MKDLSKYKLDWIAVALAISGQVFNAYKVAVCWPLWITANILFALHFGPKKEKAYLVLLTVYTILNFYAWYKWVQ